MSEDPRREEVKRLERKSERRKNSSTSFRHRRKQMNYLDLKTCLLLSIAFCLGIFQGIRPRSVDIFSFIVFYMSIAFVSSTFYMLHGKWSGYIFLCIVILLLFFDVLSPYFDDCLRTFRV